VNIDPSLPLAFRAARLFGMRIEEIFHDEDRRSLATEIKKDILYKFTVTVSRAGQMSLLPRAHGADQERIFVAGQKQVHEVTL
jgi:DNA-binding XRE family transcriptional regulator